jgi:hypothetical protein
MQSKLLWAFDIATGLESLGIMIRDFISKSPEKQVYDIQMQYSTSSARISAVADRMD